MSHYVDGYIIPIKKTKVKEYKKMAAWGCKIWMKHGALDYYECVVDDFSKHGLGFQKMCKLKKDETVIFAFVIYKSKAQRDKVNKKVMGEMTKKAMPPKMPFDMKRFAMAGCKTLVRAK